MPINIHQVIGTLNEIERINSRLQQLSLLWRRDKVEIEGESMQLSDEFKNKIKSKYLALKSQLQQQINQLP